MTIDEAIKDLQTEADLAQRQPETGIYDALKLGIEALKRCKAYKESHTFLHYEPMPGETKD